MKNKKVIVLSMSALLIFSSVSPALATTEYKNNTSEQLYTNLSPTGNVDIKILKSNNQGVTYKLSINNKTAVIDSNFDQQTFTITDENNNTEEYKVSDFAQEPTKEEILQYSEVHQPIEGVTDPNLLFKNPQIKPIGNAPDISILNYDSRDTYLGDITTALEMKNATWTNPNTYTIGGFKVQVVKGVERTVSKTLKKFTFEGGTTLVSIAAAFLTYARAGTQAAMLGLVKEVLEVGLDYISGKKTLFFEGIKETVGRGFNIVGRGFTLKTKTYTFYNKVTEGSNSARKAYSSGGLAYFFNDYSNAKAAQVAYQQFLYIVGQRSTPPKESEF